MKQGMATWGVEGVQGWLPLPRPSSYDMYPPPHMKQGCRATSGVLGECAAVQTFSLCPV
jgi:hypothetical protein